MLHVFLTLVSITLMSFFKGIDKQAKNEKYKTRRPELLCYKT